MSIRNFAKCLTINIARKVHELQFRENVFWPRGGSVFAGSSNAMCLTCCRAREHERQHEQRQQRQPHAPASVACRRVRRSALWARRRGTVRPARAGRPRARHVRAHPPATRAAAPPATSHRCCTAVGHRATHPTPLPSVLPYRRVDAD